MKVSSVLEVRIANRQGKYSVKIRISDKGNVVYTSTGIYATREEFDQKTGLLIATGKNRQYAHRNNSVIVEQLARMDEIITEYKKKRVVLTPTQLKEIYLSPSAKETNRVSFNSYFRDFINKKIEKSTKETYITTLKMIEGIYADKLQFEDINYSWLEDYERRLKIKGLSVNYIAINLRNIRAVYNNAIDNEVIGLEHYPFRRFKIKHEKTRKRNIVIEDLRILFNYQGNEPQMWAIDMAKLIFFLIGINIKDLFLLSTFENGYAVYRRAKTKAHYSIKIESEAEAILQKYRLPDGQFSFQRQFIFSHSFMKKINKYLKEVASLAKLPHITTYTLRHTWATIAAELEIPKETIAAALGHSQNTVTDIYINFNQKKIDEANRKVIDKIML
ncbi:MAG: site-specific integrase [Tannerella sp.]|jgi:integrase|nr:site-specific integrase [Tannerella sp.]